MTEWLDRCHFGDCLETLRRVPDGIVNTCVTSPPYFGLRDYGHAGQIGLEPTPDEFIGKLVEVFREVRRVLRGDGTLWVNMGDSYGAAKQLQGIPWRLAFALQSDGWTLRQDIVWAKPNPMPESVTDRCTKSHEYIFLLSKSANYYYNADAIQEASVGEPPVSRMNLREGVKVAATQSGGIDSSTLGTPADGRRNKRSVWTVSTKPYSGAHFATFPTDLIEPCVLAGAPAGGVVLDPFFGSGTTGEVAQALGRRFIGCELNGDYAPLQRERLRQPSLTLETA